MHQRHAEANAALRKATNGYHQVLQVAAEPVQFAHVKDATLLSSVKAAENSAAREFKDWCFAERKSQAAKLKARIQEFEIHFQTAGGGRGDRPGIPLQRDCACLLQRTELMGLGPLRIASIGTREWVIL